MGILNRLIGDQRKLYQSKNSQDYYFKDLENKITFNNLKDSYVLSHEIVYIRNTTGSTDQNSFSGMIISKDPIFTADYSNELWGILNLNFDEICNFIISDNFKVPSEEKFDPLLVVNKFGIINKLKSSEINETTQKALDILKLKFPDSDYLDQNEKINPLGFYCSSLYLQVERLSKKYDLKHLLTKNGTISGISKRGFTQKDFMGKFTTGDKKIIWGNPYILITKEKGIGESKFMLNKASGILEINLELEKEKAKDLAEKIENAGVSSFYLGKKGLAYVESIKI
jgi:hypothetical protein